MPQGICPRFAGHTQPTSTPYLCQSPDCRIRRINAPHSQWRNQIMPLLTNHLQNTSCVFRIPKPATQTAPPIRGTSPSLPLRRALPVALPLRHALPVALPLRRALHAPHAAPERRHKNLFRPKRLFLKFTLYPRFNPLHRGRLRQSGIFRLFFNQLGFMRRRGHNLLNLLEMRINLLRRNFQNIAQFGALIFR